MWNGDQEAPLLLNGGLPSQVTLCGLGATDLLPAPVSIVPIRIRLETGGRNSSISTLGLGAPPTGRSEAWHLGDPQR
jgi:hypothetical protein